MKKTVLIFLFAPLFCLAQQHHAGEKVTRTAWDVLVRATFRYPLNIFYSISCVNGSYFLDLRAMHSDHNMVVARGAELALMLEDGTTVQLFNSAYATSCTGCGARGYATNNEEGISLSYPLTKNDMETLRDSYVDFVRLYNASGFWEKRVSENNGEILMKEIAAIQKTNL